MVAASGVVEICWRCCIAQTGAADARGDTSHAGPTARDIPCGLSRAGQIDLRNGTASAVQWRPGALRARSTGPPTTSRRICPMTSIGLQPECTVTRRLGLPARPGSRGFNAPGSVSTAPAAGSAGHAGQDSPARHPHRPRSLEISSTISLRCRPPYEATGTAKEPGAFSVSPASSSATATGDGNCQPGVPAARHIGVILTVLADAMPTRCRPLFDAVGRSMALRPRPQRRASFGAGSTPLRTPSPSRSRSARFGTPSWSMSPRAQAPC